MGYMTRCNTCNQAVKAANRKDLDSALELHRSREAKNVKKHQVMLSNAEWEYLDEVRDLYEVKSRSHVLRIILSKEIKGFNHLLDEKDVGKARNDGGGWAWLCKKHLEEAGRSNEITGRVPLFSNMEGYCCDVKGCSESNTSYVSISSNFWIKEVSFQ